MPSPVAHSISAYFFQEHKPLMFFKVYWQNFFFLIFLANLPDIDFLPGLLIGEPNRFHHGLSHSLGFTIFFGVLFGYFFSKKNKERFLPYFLIISLVYYSHVILDFFTADFSPEFGVMLFWPINSVYYISPVIFFDKVMRSSSSHDFFISILNENNFVGAIKEIFIMTMVALLLKIYRKLS